MEQPPESWTLQLAAFLQRGSPDGQALAALADTAACGDAGAVSTRLTILRLLDQRARLAAQVAAPQADALPLPEWPGPSPSLLPPFHPVGLAGISLVSACHDQVEILVETLPSWLGWRVEELLLIEGTSSPHLGDVLAARGIADPRIRIVRIDCPDLTPAQAFNAGFRLARHQRILALACATDFGASDPTRLDLMAGEARSHVGAADGSAFALDLDRRDLAQVGGFNEYLDTADFAFEELLARLQAIGVRATPWPLPLTSRAAARQPLVLGGTTLRNALHSSPDFMALRNRYIAAVMPDWQPEATRAFGLTATEAQGVVLRALAGSALMPSLVVVTDGCNHALIDLVSRHVGGAPILLGPRRLDIVLGRPADDVCALDVALAGGQDPDKVKSRRAWLVVDIAADAIPIAGSPAQIAFQRLCAHAVAQRFTLALRLPADIAADATEPLSDFPLVPDLSEMTRGFRPYSLRDLLAATDASALPHGTFAFNPEAVADFAALSRRGPAILLRRPKLFIDAQHGLGNRLRAIGSAGAIAAATGRELVIIWQADVHCDCRFEDLFDPFGGVLSQGFHSEAEAMGMELYNYMDVEPGSAKDRTVALGAFGDAYLRSAYPLVHPQSTWHSENDWLRRLQPNAVVRHLVASVRRPNDVAVHIRMEGGTDVEHLPYESPVNWTEAAHREIDHWRKRSHFSYFLRRLDHLIAEDTAKTIFLACDTPEARHALTQRYGGRIACLPHQITGRSTPALVHALADALLLGRAPRLLGSTWSSFTELAARLAPRPLKVELSGRDF